VDTLILSALRYHPSPAHFSIDEAITFARLVKARKTYFTHIAHDLDHEETNRKLPDDIRLGFDGLEIPF
jgi:phosphoribosyl 1,2-cyclic phosphate phosphodiesterase